MEGHHAEETPSAEVADDLKKIDDALDELIEKVNAGHPSADDIAKVKHAIARIVALKDGRLMGPNGLPRIYGIELRILFRPLWLADRHIRRAHDREHRRSELEEARRRLADLKRELERGAAGGESGRTAADATAGVGRLIDEADRLLRGPDPIAASGISELEIAKQSLLGDHFPLLFGKSFKLIFSALETINSLLEEARKAADDGFNYGPIGELIGYLRAARDTKHDLQRMLGL